MSMAYLFLNALITSLLSSEVCGAASVYIVLTSTSVRAYLHVLFVLPTFTVSNGRNNKSAWCTSSFVETSNLGLVIFLGAGK